MRRAEYKIKGGKLVKIELDETESKISKVKITGDFFLHPEYLIDELEEILLGHPLDETALTTLIENFLINKQATILGVSSGDIAKCIIMAANKDD